jgi:peptidoglycan/LPS O-acetylase OafA/YrhL
MAEPTAPDRIRPLDGLRGIAAVVVVLHHVSMTVPEVARQYMDSRAALPPVGSLAWWLLFTPLKLLTAGPEAVFVFFVLSGLVLTRAVGGSPRDYDWFAYVPRRLLRLLLPVAGAVALGTVAYLVARPSSIRFASPWLRADAVPVTPIQVADGLDVLFGVSHLDNPLWSLRYEVLFSLLLPVFCLLLGIGARASLALLPGLAVVAGLGAWLASPLLTYLPMFAIGCLLGGLLPMLTARARALTPGARRAAGATGLLLALVLIGSEWELRAAGVPFDVALHVSLGAATLGAALLVALAGAGGATSRLLITRPVQHLGRVSFSLYLVHVPVLFATAALLSTAPLLVVAVVALVVAFALTELFARGIEGPAHRLSIRVGRAVAARGA